MAATSERQNGLPMAHALAAFIREQMDERQLRNRDIVRDSGLSRAQVSKYANDRREVLTRLPERETLEGLARAFRVTTDFLLGKAIESLGLGYSSGDFVNSVATATDRELLDEIDQRLRKRGEERDRSSAAIAADDLNEMWAQLTELLSSTEGVAKVAAGRSLVELRRAAGAELTPEETRFRDLSNAVVHADLTGEELVVATNMALQALDIANVAMMIVPGRPADSGSYVQATSRFGRSGARSDEEHQAAAHLELHDIEDEQTTS